MGETGVEQALRLLDHALIEPFEQTATNASAQLGALPTQAENSRFQFGQRLQIALGGPSALGDLDGPHQALALLKVGNVVLIGTQAQKTFAQFVIRLQSQLLAQRRVLGHVHHAVPLQHRFEIKAGAADHHRQFAALPDIRESLEETPLELEDAEFAAWFGDIDKMIGDLGVLGQVLAGADVHTAKNLSRVGRDDLAAQGTSRLHTEGGLARGGGAENNEEVDVVHEKTIQKKNREFNSFPLPFPAPIC